MFRPARSYRSWVAGCTAVVGFLLLTHILLLRPTPNNTSSVSWQSWLRRPRAKPWTLSRDPSTSISSSSSKSLPLSEKFLTFLPHSGLHNQRIALINAAILAHALNRTLLMPELNLGKATFWRPSGDLAEKLARCPGNNLKTESCYDYRDYVPVPVDEIFDLTPLHELGIRTMQRHDMSQDYFLRYWGIDENNADEMMYILDDTTRYSYQIHDELVVPNATLKQFQTRVDIQDLAKRQEPFILFGSLFGSQRLALTRSDLLNMREYLRQQVGVKHPAVLHEANEIVDRLGGPNNYLSVHLRQGDGRFKKEAKKTTDQIRRALKKCAQSHNNDGSDGEDEDDEETNLAELQQHIDDRPLLLKACVAAQGKQRHPSLRLIYMATDTKSPREKFADLYDEFVCLFTLNDFPDVVQAIRDTISDEDPYLRDGKRLLPLVDGEVAANADHFVPTPKSTFSGYIRQRNALFHELI
ncbi:hypothetical protein BDB00DRAFT_855813 [Zychaea mexicana]|uniref:uncharacterized protein n=1 Tax=Zychaea mexicana TaxID=64656 RepID=UPI0022FDE4CA|nr:uncharacterized protein BDB00DRAFT_855813 [Zychaea mexicana]KAI9484411.1 hypothetical protein BDB00DRAFT_855813 [Zychaea mexicana]